MSKLNLDAALIQLRGEALAHLAAIDLLLNKPAAISEHTQFVDEIKSHAIRLAEAEEARAVLQKYFAQQEEPQSAEDA
jgi:hypothetical protein